MRDLVNFISMAYVPGIHAMKSTAVGNPLLRSVCRP